MKNNFDLPLLAISCLGATDSHIRSNAIKVKSGSLDYNDKETKINFDKSQSSP